MDHLLLFAFIYLLSLLAVQNISAASCGPVEEGTAFSIKCRNQSPDLAFHYYVVTWHVDGVNDTIATCTERGGTSCTETYPGELVVKYAFFQSTLTIEKVSRIHPFDMETRWICRFRADDNKDNYTGIPCSSLEVYAKPTEPTCGPAVLNTTTSEVVVTCVTERVYPQALCYLYLGMNESDSKQMTVSSVSYNHYELDEDPVYYRSECTIAVPLTSVAAHGTYFLVSMYPDVTDGPQLDVKSQAYRFENIGASAVGSTTSTNCAPAEEGTVVSFSCSNRSPSRTTDNYLLTWSADVFRETVATCNEYDHSCDVTYPIHFDTSISGTDSTLTIKNVSRVTPFDMETEWICQFTSENNTDNYIYVACLFLELYAKPEEPTCRPAVLDRATFETVVTCVTERVYPQALCNISLELSDTDVLPTSVLNSYNHYELNETPVYYRSECTIAISLPPTTASRINFLVSMYPDVTEGQLYSVASPVYQLDIIDKPKEPTCEPAVLNSTTLEVVVTCATERIYPEALCDIYLGMNASVSSKIAVSSVTYNHYEMDETPVYYRSECTMAVSLTSVAVYGTYFLVNMYPDITEGLHYGVKSQVYQVDNITKPEKPDCEFPMYNSTTFEIIVTCVTESVYSRLECAPYLGMNKSDYYQGSVSAVSYEHTEVREPEISYISECTLAVSLAEFAYYGNYLKVKMFPAVSGGSKYGVDSDVMRIDLVLISEDNPSSEIKQTKELENDDDISFAVTVTLGVLLAITMCLALILGCLACKARRKTPEPPMTSQSSKPLSESDPKADSVQKHVGEM